MKLLNHSQPTYQILSKEKDWMDFSPQRSTTGVHFRLTVLIYFINGMYLFTNKCTLYDCADNSSLSCAATGVEEVMSSLQMDGKKSYPMVDWKWDAGKS